jgi:hypothetical protein
MVFNKVTILNNVIRLPNLRDYGLSMVRNG